MAQPTLPVQALVHAFHCRDANCVERPAGKSCVETQAVVRRMKAHVDSCHIRQQQGQADVSECKVCRLWDALHRTKPPQVGEFVDAALHGRAADVARLLADAPKWMSAPKWTAHIVNAPAPVSYTHLTLPTILLV